MTAVATPASAQKSTGPLVGDQHIEAASVNWDALSKPDEARGEPRDRRPCLRRQENSSSINSQRTVLLGLLLVQLDSVPFDDVAILLGTKPRNAWRS